LFFVTAVSCDCDMNEGMTMVFRAGDPAMLKAVRPGDRVRFVPERVNGQFTVMNREGPVISGTD
jgi:Cu/Ag efflux protein CusF